jgi:type I restriction enzyme M protein
MSCGSSFFVQRLWALCNVLRDDGITYHQYVEELALLLFLKMAKQTGAEARLPGGARWDDLRQRDGATQLPFYQALLARLAAAADPRVREIFHGASTSLRGSRHLAELVAAVDALELAAAPGSEADGGGLGELYEGLLEKNASELKSGAGQYFTPRPLVASIVHLLRPRRGESIQDPAAGTGGFLIYADRYIKDHSGPGGPAARLLGVELVPSTRRLALMNLTLHDAVGEVLLGDALSSLGAELGPADVILTNPPFGNKRGAGAPARPELRVAPRNKQLLFLQHCYRSLKPGGRAAVVVPDNVLFEEHAGTATRAELLATCNLHTILRLPTGIFYAPGVKTNVLFFSRPLRPGAGDASARLWIYDLRTGLPPLGKRAPLTREHLRDFERCFGDDPHGEAPRTDSGPRGRFRSFSRQELRDRGDSLDLCWLGGPSAEEAAAAARTPAELTAEILRCLGTATAELQALAAELC